MKFVMLHRLITLYRVFVFRTEYRMCYSISRGGYDYEKWLAVAYYGKRGPKLLRLSSVCPVGPVKMVNITQSVTQPSTIDN